MEEVRLPSTGQLEISDILMPEKSFSSGRYGYEFVDIQYISDIHLESHIADNGLGDELAISILENRLSPQVIRCINQICKGIMTTNKVQTSILIGGDVSDTPIVADCFFHTLFLWASRREYEEWKCKKKKYNEHRQWLLRCGLSIVELDDVALCKKEVLEYHVAALEKKRKHLKKFFRYDKRHYEMTRYELLERIGEKYPSFVKNLIIEVKNEERIIRTIESDYEEAIADCKRDIELSKGFLSIYYVLGNHELSAFNTVEEALEVYKGICEKNRIVLINNQSILIDDSYKEKKIRLVGGIGMPKYNEQFNCDSMVTAKTLTREQEIQESEAFYDVYCKSVKQAEEKNEILLVLTHFPTNDWIPNNSVSAGCIYFTGHTHRNSISSSNGSITYADNQVGYHKKKYELKMANIGTLRNPYFGLSDGVFETTPQKYLAFMIFCEEKVQGVASIEKALNPKGKNLKNDERHLYVIKKNGFYGFFLTTSQGTRICSGGVTKKVSDISDIHYFYDVFSEMIEHYVTALYPMRKYQEAISAELKKLGLNGTIHGSIVDIDFFHHVMINPFDGKVTFYYSPFAGIVQDLGDFQNVLCHMEKEREELNERVTLIEGKRASDIYEIAKKETKILPSVQTGSFVENQEFEVVSLSEGAYKASRVINQLQRLFTCNVLRQWDEEYIKRESDVYKKYLLSLPQKT